MEIKDQVCSLVLSQRLKELGVKQFSLFSWVELLTGHHAETEFKIYMYGIFPYSALREYSAFTAAELLEMLPQIDEPYRLSFGIENPDIGGGKYFTVEDMTEYPKDTYFYDDNFANALAKMIIHLIVKGIYKP